MLNIPLRLPIRLEKIGTLDLWNRDQWWCIRYPRNWFSVGRYPYRDVGPMWMVTVAGFTVFFDVWRRVKAEEFFGGPCGALTGKTLLVKKCVAGKEAQTTKP